jgi:hypothetical protein
MLWLGHLLLLGPESEIRSCENWRGGPIPSLLSVAKSWSPYRLINTGVRRAPQSFLNHSPCHCWQQLWRVMSVVCGCGDQFHLGLLRNWHVHFAVRNSTDGSCRGGRVLNCPLGGDPNLPGSHCSKWLLTNGEGDSALLLLGMLTLELCGAGLLPDTSVATSVMRDSESCDLRLDRYKQFPCSLLTPGWSQGGQDLVFHQNLLLHQEDLQDPTCQS